MCTGGKLYCKKNEQNLELVQHLTEADRQMTIDAFVNEVGILHRSTISILIELAAHWVPKALHKKNNQILNIDVYVAILVRNKATEAIIFVGSSVEKRFEFIKIIWIAKFKQKTSYQKKKN